MAHVLVSMGQYADALEEYRAVLVVQERDDVLGPEHPSTLKTRQRLDEVLESMRLNEGAATDNPHDGA